MNHLQDLLTSVSVNMSAYLSHVCVMAFLKSSKFHVKMFHEFAHRTVRPLSRNPIRRLLTFSK
jgi:hypothetical protein